MKLNKQQLAVKNAVLGIVRKFIHNLMDQEDVIQEIYRKLIEEYSLHYCDIGKVVNWSVKIAINECCTFYRRQKSAQLHIKEYAYDCDMYTTAFRSVDSRRACEYVLDKFRSQLSESTETDYETRVNQEFILNKKSKLEIAKDSNSSYKRVIRTIDKTKKKLNKEAEELFKKENNNSFE